MELGPCLRLGNVFFDLCKNFARVAAPLTEKLSKGQLQAFFGLAEEEITALSWIKAEFLRPPLLTFHRSKRLYSKYRRLQ